MLASVTDPLSHVTTMKYDSVGNVIQVVNALNQATTRSYSSTGQPLTVTDPLSHTTSLAYSGSDVTSITNPIYSLAGTEAPARKVCCMLRPQVVCG